MPSSEEVPAKGTWITVAGEVKNVGQDIQNAPCIALKIDPPVDSVRCVFPTASASRLAMVTVGTRVVIRGRCDGTPKNAILRECQLF